MSVSKPTPQKWIIKLQTNPWETLKSLDKFRAHIVSKFFSQTTFF